MTDSDLESRIEQLEAEVYELRISHLRLANAVADLMPARAKFFASLIPDSDD
jgi:hypothetical protein